MSLRKVYRGERMESVFESIMTGLKEAVDDAKSTNKKLSRRTVTILPVKEYQADQVKKNQKFCGHVAKFFRGISGSNEKDSRGMGSGNKSSIRCGQQNIKHDGDG